MKRIGGFIIFFFILYIIYHDLTTGTLSVANGEKKIEEELVEVVAEEVSTSLPFQEVEIKAGDTLLSIVESLNQENSSSVSISSIISDFEELNPGVKANSLKIGKIYKIPTY